LKKWEKTSSTDLSHKIERDFEIVLCAWRSEPQYPDTDPKHFEVLDPNPDLYTMKTDLKPLDCE
jgi:hypothetical protein